MAAHRVLVVDDEPNMRRVLSAMLERQGLDVSLATDGTEAAAMIASEGADLVITDLKMKEMDGLQLLRHLHTHHQDVPVVLITAHGTVDTAVKAMKLGAFDFVSKPFEQREITAVVEKALRAAALYKTRPRDARDQGPVRPDDGAYGMIGRSQGMDRVFSIIEKVASSPSTVLITGESGTGKELVARALHEHSSRANKPFITINCAAIPDTLVESELFGHEKGAFTGAVAGKPGRFELADGGTLFLDEIGEIPAEMQVKLLRVLQESAFERVGGVRTINVDVRLVTATNRDLTTEIGEGRFREDLYYRLNVVPIHLPPLRERREDIPLLVEHFLQHFNTRLAKDITGVGSQAMTVLSQFPWPGNIRQLENILERTVLFSDGPSLSAADLPDELSGMVLDQAQPTAALPEGAGLKDLVRATTEQVERRTIQQALEETGGNVTHAAKKLKISRKSLQNKMKDWGLREPTEKKT